MERLNNKKIKFLRGLAHDLKPVVQVGQDGVSEASLKELRRCLSDHELIKVRIACGDQVEFRDLLSQIEAGSGSETVQTVGHTVVLYKAATPPRLVLPD